jgi:hypothetical protein
LSTLQIRGSLEQIQRWRERARSARVFGEGVPVEAVAEIRAHDPHVGAKLRCGGSACGGGPAAGPGPNHIRPEAGART